jgi:hypothetical protein
MAAHHFLHIQSEIDTLLRVADSMRKHAHILGEQAASLARHRDMCNKYISKQHGELINLRSKLIERATKKPRLDLLPEENMTSSYFEMNMAPQSQSQSRVKSQTKPKSQTKSKPQTKSRQQTKSRGKSKSDSGRHSVSSVDEEQEEEQDEEQEQEEEEEEEQEEQKSEDNQSNVGSAGSVVSAESGNSQEIKDPCPICLKNDPTKRKRNGHSGAHYKNKSLSDKKPPSIKKHQKFLLKLLSNGTISHTDFTKRYAATITTKKQGRPRKSEEPRKELNTPKFSDNHDDVDELHLPKKRKVRTPKRFTESVA